MINPNEIRSTFWLVFIFIVAVVIFCGFCYFKHKKENKPIAPAEDLAPAPVETGEDD